MSMIKLALTNFKAGFKNYLSLVISLSFTIMIFLNFQNLLDSHVLDELGEENARNVEIMVQVITLVLICFMFFFIWYSTNVFLTKQKKEIGIYVFMGLSNQKIAALYMLETSLIGFMALVFGVMLGQLTTQLFLMIIAAMSQITIAFDFRLALTPIIVTSLVYLFIYLLFVGKGYINILRSSVLDMVSANRVNEFVKQKTGLLVIKSILGIGVLSGGYYLAIKDGGAEVMANVLAAVILVILGTYLLFGGLLPLLYQTLAKKKHFLYKKERTLWINTIIFRMKRNYRTYAIVSVLMLCSVTALATGFALNERYKEIVKFSSTYSYQLPMTNNDLEEDFLQIVEKQNEIRYSTSADILQVDASHVKTDYNISSASFVSYSQMKDIAKQANLSFDFGELAADEVIEVSNLPLLSLTMEEGITIHVDGKEYRQVAETSQPYLGYFQRLSSFYIVNDSVYESLRPIGQSMTMCNVKIKDDSKFQASIDDLKAFVKENENDALGLVKNDPETNEAVWIKILYAVCIFVFMVFVLASGSIIFMKLYNDAFEEKERYDVLRRIGISRTTLKKAISKELRFAYVVPLLVMSISSYFSVHSLGEMMKTQLLWINFISVILCYIVCYIAYRLSVIVYLRNADIRA